MLVREIMPTQVHTIGQEASLDEALAEMRRHHVRQLPVVEERRLVGMITDRDLRRPTIRGRRATADDLFYFEKQMRVGHVMTQKVRTVRPDTPVAQAARTLVRLKVGALPVVDAEGLLAGIVTTTDLLAVLVEDEERLAAQRDEEGR